MNIRVCVDSLLHQNYPNFEVLVLDDESDDETPEILKALAKKDTRLKILVGKPLPPDWMGKNWACHQLSQAATGDYLFFTDADTFHHPETLRESISACLVLDADLLSAIPHERMDSLGEKLLLPYFFFSALAFLPISLAHRLQNPSLCFAIGQFMFFKRSSYSRIGGHKGIKTILMEDLTLGRRIKAAGLRWRMVDGGLRTQCRMYHGFSETWHGLIRFLFLGYEGHIFEMGFVWLVTGIVFIGPIIIIILALARILPLGFPYTLDVIAVGLTLVLWITAYWRLGLPPFLAFLYPVTFSLNFIMTFISMISTLSGQTTWKGRTIGKSGSHYKITPP